MPEQDIAAFGVPVPVDLSPEVINTNAKRLLLRILLAKILSRAEESLDEKRGLDKIAACITGPKGHLLARWAIEIMGKDAVIPVGGGEIAEQVEQPVLSFGA